jgi:hypothetical protein
MTDSHGEGLEAAPLVETGKVAGSPSTYEADRLVFLRGISVAYLTQEAHLLFVYIILRLA